MSPNVRQPLPVEALVSDHARREADDALDMATAAKRTVAVVVRESITVPAGDPIDDLVEELRNTPSRP